MSGLWHRAFAMLRGVAQRKRVGKDPDASTAIVDSQSMKTTEEGAGSNGYDAHKNVKGRKRHLLVDTLGLYRFRSMSPPPTYRTGPERASYSPGSRTAGGAPPEEDLGRRRVQSGKEFAKWCEEQGGWELEVIERDKEAKGFEVLPKRWIVERTFGWLRRDRCLPKDYERKAQTSETLIKVTMIRLILRRLARAA